MVNKNPNILVIQADQLNPDMLGAYQNPIAKTPHIGEQAPWNYNAPDQRVDQGLRSRKGYSDWAYGDVLKGSSKNTLFPR